MDKLPPMTVAIPAYKRAHAISPLLETLAAQAGPDDELIVIDDASGDDIETVVAKVGRFRLIRNPTNLGMVGNWNACLRAATHDWVCIVHHDDTAAPDALQTLRRACALAGGPALVVHWRDQSNLGHAFRCRLSEPGPWAVLKIPTIPSGAVVHRRVIEEAGVFDPQWKYSADLEYFPRICARFPSVVIESPDVVRYALHKNNYQYDTWRQPDFEQQLMEIQRLIVSYAHLSEHAAKYEFEERMASMYGHMLNSAMHLGDRSLVRRVARRLAAGRTNGRKLRLQASVAAVLGWMPGSRQRRFNADSFEVVNP